MLLPGSEITVERLATWIALHSQLDGLPWVVARPMPDSAQARVRTAAAEEASLAGLDEDSVRNAVDLFTEVSFQERAEAIAEEVSAVVPEILESVPDLARRIKQARNDVAHHLSSGLDETFRVRALEWLIVANSTS